MALIDLDLISNSTQTIDSSNGADGDTLQLSLVSNGTLIIDGVDLTLTNLVGGGVITSTTIVLQNGADLVVDTALAGVSAGSTFNYQIGAGTSLTINAAAISASLLDGTTVDFSNAAGQGHFTYDSGLINLNISSPPDIIGVNNGDRITVVDSASVQQVGNTVTFYGPLGGLQPIASYDIPAGATYSYSNATDTLTFLTPCFVRGTLIATPEGPVAVERLKAGDLISSLNHGAVAIKWVGNRTIDPKTLDKPRNDLPIRIKAGAIAENMPERDLAVSPDHCMFIADALVPAKLLVNGTTITQPVTLSPVDYFHIELEEHDVIWANGALAETYLDLGNRAAFLEPGVLQFTSPKARQAKSCYPLAYSGPAVDAARDIIAERETALGYTSDEAKAS
ncbi:Hint domain-containing protein [Phyllobacterium sp. 0TCS1.6C]|uniref:Hint domain-containing protein n=1 Tax=unclassified Phyllobacterium TaxID=2638441 RepID=UPI0022640E0A|nr:MULTISPECIES: Hint domain-containing protein [unclassified Phyllobacterium]MCX8280293.1 Hint domain-containing protein [Phyllobacterium sp. 0TCS1.6C]MCX8294146.1 Hint domain-containing protein [Phyllobacterium sp. 0TCS1.6A]